MGYIRLLQELVPDYQANLKIAKKMSGGFVAAFMPNDLIHDLPKKGNKKIVNMMGCCSPAGVNSIFYIWNNILTVRGNEVRVNFHITRRSPWIDIISYLPYQGKIEIRVHKRCKLYIRMPVWVKKKDAKVEINGRKIPKDFENEYIKFEVSNINNRITVEYPVHQAENKELVGGNKTGTSFTNGQTLYTIRWKGNTVISLKPSGKYLPIYQREHLDTEKCSYKEIPDSPSFPPMKEFNF
jgi:DUF1680 family protein